MNQTTKKIFIIDDEPDLLRLASDLLTKEGYLAASAASAKEGLEKLRKNPADLVLLDLQMPGMDGFEACRVMKADPALKSLPIIIVSVKSREADVVVGLELGADDYVRKPFRKRELLARIKTALRRKEAEAPEEQFSAGPLTVDYRSYVATVEGVPVKLAPKEFQLLVYFFRRQGQVLTRAVISEKVWGIEHLATSRTIDTHVKVLRNKLGDCGRWILAVPGVGYRFEPSSASSTR